MPKALFRADVIDWSDICRRKQHRYRISVSLYREVSASGFGSNRHISNEVCAPSLTSLSLLLSAQTMHQHNAATPLAGSSSEDYAHQLHVLHQIHKTGGLTDTEYETAKAKILAEM